MCDFSFFFQNDPIPWYRVNVHRKQMRLLSVMLLHPNSQSYIRHWHWLAGSFGSVFSHPLSRLLPRQIDRYNSCSLEREQVAAGVTVSFLFPDHIYIFILHSAPLQYPEWFLFLIVISRISTKIYRSSLHFKCLARNSLKYREAKEEQATSSSSTISPQFMTEVLRGLSCPDVMHSEWEREDLAVSLQNPTHSDLGSISAQDP